MPLTLDTLERVLAEADAVEDLLGDIRTRLSAIYVLLDRTMHEAHPPLCPKCGSGMIVRSQRQNPESRFLGCLAWPKCKGSQSLDEWRKAAEAAVRGSNLTEPA